MKKESEKIAAGLSGGEIIFEGMTSIRAVLAAGENGGPSRRILRILYDAAKEKSKARELAYLRRRGEALGFPVIPETEEKIAELALGGTHGGLLAVCGGRAVPPVEGYAPGARDFCVMLEGIEDPYNFGYALRSLYAAGVDAVILPPRNWMEAAGIVCRASAGASELIPMYTAEGTAAAEYLKRSGMKVVCAAIENSEPVWDAELSRPLFLVVGGEKRGISRSLLDMADSVVRIDYGREYNASLSAASAAAVLAFEVARKSRS